MYFIGLIPRLLQRCSGMALLAMVPLAVFGDTLAPPDREFLMGAGTHVAQRKMKAENVVRLAVSLGLNSVRDEIYWDDVEPRPGVFLLPERLAELDRLYRSASRHGISPLIILNYGNRHYEGGGFPTRPESIAAFSRYASWVVSRYRGVVNHFEVWNEWNNGIGVPRELRHRGSPQSYVRLLAEASSAVRKANPEALVLAGAVAEFDENWIRGFLKAGGMKYADGFSVHPYTYFDRTDPTPDRAIEHLDELDRMMREHTGGSVPIYVTEIGWPTHQGRFGVSEERQAEYLDDFLSAVRQRPWIRGVWWYELKDSGEDPGVREHRFGLYRSDGKARKSAAQALHKKMIID